MKRSEAVNKLQELLNDNDINFYAETILNFLELNIGMSPPDDKGEVYGWNEGYIRPPEWEPESE